MRGLCRVCGKSTRLEIHQDCGAKLTKRAERPTPAQDAAVRRRYRAGRLPDWMLK